ncbi:MAG: XdhC family protein [Alphaproteobacteria bacterium]
MKRALLDLLLEARAANEPAALITRLNDGSQTLVLESAEVGAMLGSALIREAQDALAADVNRSVETDQGTIFIQVFNPPPRLVIVGAVHIAQPLAPMAAMLGHAVTVIDPRQAFATLERMPGITIVSDWPDAAMAALAPDLRTAVVTLTHDPKLDDPALDVALRSKAFYVGALGSRRTHAARLERLAARGLDAAALARIRGPVGLDIGAVSPAEIAVSILAEMIQVRHRG